MQLCSRRSSGTGFIKRGAGQGRKVAVRCKAFVGLAARLQRRRSLPDLCQQPVDAAPVPLKVLIDEVAQPSLLADEGIGAVRAAERKVQKLPSLHLHHPPALLPCVELGALEDARRELHQSPRRCHLPATDVELEALQSEPHRALAGSPRGVEGRQVIHEVVAHPEADKTPRALDHAKRRRMLELHVPIGTPVVPTLPEEASA
mmetsp:Transcript_81608/g.243361  ORF Transcript_81608/g.243361 Transcript_81608/m.243361 type:complete len:203 (+) Transcript_81608:520-1128(+)